MRIKYPDIDVELSGQDGNALAIMARVARALKANGVERQEIDSFYAEAKSGDYAHLLQTCGEWVNIS